MRHTVFLKLPSPLFLSRLQSALPSLPAASTARSKFSLLFLNALACYLLAYQAVHFAAEAALVFMARRANVPGIWSLGGVRFILGDGGWRRETVLAVYSVGPALALGLGIVAFCLFWLRLRYRRGLVKLLLLWVAFHALNVGLGGLLADTVTQSGSWYVPNWLLGGGGTWPSTVLALLFAGLQMLLGFLLTIPFLLAQDSHTALKFSNRSQLITYTILGPWLVGSLLLLLSKLPQASLNECLHFCTLGLLLGPLALGCQQELTQVRQLVPQTTRVAWGLVGLAVLGLLAWRLALGAGVLFR